MEDEEEKPQPVSAEDDQAEKAKIAQMKGKTRRAGVANESVSQEQMSNYKKPVHAKPAEASAKIVKVIKENEKMQVLFGHLDEGAIGDVGNAFYPMEFKEGASIINQGDEGDRFYILDDGSVDVFVARKGDDGSLGAPTKVANLPANTIFGELALMYNAPRAASIKCHTPACKVFALDREDFQMLVMSSQEQKHKMYEGWLQDVPILKTLNHYELSKLADLLTAELYEAGDEIITQGDVGDKFFIMEEGEAKAYIHGEKGEIAVKTYNTAGDYFGEIALITDAPRKATIRATADSQIHWVSKEDFDMVIGPIKDILQKSISEYPQYAEFLK